MLLREKKEKMALISIQCRINVYLQYYYNYNVIGNCKFDRLTGRQVDRMTGRQVDRSIG